jgi:hypothetical protein
VADSLGLSLGHGLARDEADDVRENNWGTRDDARATTATRCSARRTTTTTPTLASAHGRCSARGRGQMVTTVLRVYFSLA